MKRYFDTSILIAACVESERNHDVCLDLVSKSSEAFVVAHGLAECFSILTGGRISIQQSPGIAAQIIEANIVNRMLIVTLTAQETLNTIKGAEKAGIRGGGIYDALHLAAARKCKADEIYTLNLRHFQAFAPDLCDRIHLPNC